MSFESILLGLSTNGPYIFITGLVLFFAIKYAFLFYKNYERKLKLQKIDLLNHDLFNRLYYQMQNEIPNLHTGDEKKDDVASDFLMIKFYVWKKELEKILKDNMKIIEKGEEQELRKIINRQFSETITMYETIAEKIGIPKIFVEKFNQWHSERVNLTKQFIDIVLNSPYYISVLNIQVIFDNYIKEFTGTIDDAKHTIRELNGQLKNIEYKRQILDYKTIQNIYEKYRVGVL